MLALSKAKSVPVREALRSAVLVLQQAKVESASLDARLLLEHVLRMSREQLLLAMDNMLTQEQEIQYRALIGARCDRQPIAQLVGKREFWGQEFKVTRDTLDPRPDSETVIMEALSRLTDRQKPFKIADLGVGTGCLLLSLLKELSNATAIGVDISEAAINVAKENTICFGMQSRVTFITSDWCEKLAGAFDIIVANPPYIPTRSIESLAPEVARHEPRLALDGGESGLECYRKIIAALPSVLAEDGFAVLEIGAGQQQALAEMATGQGLKAAGMRQDLSGIIRTVTLTR